MSDQPLSSSKTGASDRVRDLIAAFLVIDIQRSPDWARDLIAKIAEVKAGVLPSWERIGNAYRLYIAPEGGRIEDRNDASSAPQHFSLDDLEAAVTAWLEAIG